MSAELATAKQIFPAHYWRHAMRFDGKSVVTLSSTFQATGEPPHRTIGRAGIFRYQ
jgi:hypothetical protein